jgi:hypothetical protein
VFAGSILASNWIENPGKTYLTNIVARWKFWVSIWTYACGLTVIWRLWRNKDKRPFYILVVLLLGSGAALVILARA